MYELFRKHSNSNIIATSVIGHTWSIRWENNNTNNNLWYKPTLRMIQYPFFSPRSHRFPLFLSSFMSLTSFTRRRDFLWVYTIFFLSPLMRSIDQVAWQCLISKRFVIIGIIIHSIACITSLTVEWKSNRRHTSSRIKRPHHTLRL